MPAIGSLQGWDGGSQQDAGHRTVNYSNWVCVLCPWSNFSILFPHPILFLPGTLCLILTRIRSKSQKRLSKSPLLFPVDDRSNSPLPLYWALKLQKNTCLYITFPSPTFSPIPWGLNFELTSYTLSVMTMPIGWFCAYSWFTSSSKLWMWGDTIPALWLTRVSPPITCYLLH